MYKRKLKKHTNAVNPYKIRGKTLELIQRRCYIFDSWTTFFPFSELSLQKMDMFK